MPKWLVLSLLWALPVWANGWTVLDDGAIRSALAGRALQYEDASTQRFFTDGRTLYAAGAGESWGTWWAEAGKYCSTWPPSETPSCYGVEALGEEIRFISARATVTLGRYLEP